MVASAASDMAKKLRSELSKVKKALRDSEKALAKEAREHMKTKKAHDKLHDKVMKKKNRKKKKPSAYNLFMKKEMKKYLKANPAHDVATAMKACAAKWSAAKSS